MTGTNERDSGGASSSQTSPYDYKRYCCSSGGKAEDGRYTSESVGG